VHTLLIWTRLRKDVGVSTAARVYGGKSGDERRAERRYRLLDAGLELLGTEGLAGTTLRKVCENAGLPPRYFYENFPDLDALNVAVFDSLLEDLIRQSFVAVAQAPTELAAQVRAALRCAIDFVSDDPRKGRIALSLALASPPLAERRSRATELITTIIADLGNDYVSADADRGQLDTVARFFVGGFAEILAAWMDDPSTATRGDLLDRCTQLFLAVTSTVLNA
jgi:AcrR family transcriptional regulator